MFLGTSYIVPYYAKEALKIHYGVSDKRNIHGTSTDDEEKLLKEEGVEFHKIPFPRRKNIKTL
jgi:hypothetical protein